MSSEKVKVVTKEAIKKYNWLKEHYPWLVKDVDMPEVEEMDDSNTIDDLKKIVPMPKKPTPAPWRNPFPGPPWRIDYPPSLSTTYISDNNEDIKDWI